MLSFRPSLGQAVRALELSGTTTKKPEGFHHRFDQRPIRELDPLALANRAINSYLAKEYCRWKPD